MTQLEQNIGTQSELEEILVLAKSTEAKMQLFAQQAEKFIGKWEQTASQNDS